jgi:hypothetical protein
MKTASADFELALGGAAVRGAGGESRPPLSVTIARGAGRRASSEGCSSAIGCGDCHTPR